MTSNFSSGKQKIKCNILDTLLFVEKIYTGIKSTKVMKGDVCALSVVEEKLMKVHVV
jgi:hypothetical protein